MEVKIACLQTRLTPTFDAAVNEALQLASLADADTRVLFLPEYCGGLKTEAGKFAPPVAEQQAHPVLQALRDHAASRGVWIVVGSIAVSLDALSVTDSDSKTPSRHDTDGDRYNNRGFVISDTGEIVSHYNKIHLFDIDLSADEVYRESDVVAPGDSLCLVDTPVGLMGHTICYDLRFPQLYRDLAHSGATTLAIPAAFTKKTGEAHWHALCRARAIENGAYVIAPCAIGKIDGGGEAYGHSLVVDPWGEVVADGGDSPGIVTATIDLKHVSDARARIPSLQHDRAWTRGSQSADSPEKMTVTALR